MNCNKNNTESTNKCEEKISNNLNLMNIVDFISNSNAALKFGLKISLFGGFLIVVVYFTSIKYLPLGSFQSLTLIILVSAYNSLIFFMYLILSFIFAPFYWSMLLRADDTAAIITGQMNAASVLKIYQSNFADLRVGIRRRVFAWYLLPSISYIYLLLLLPLLHIALLKTIVNLFYALGFTSFFCSLVLVPQEKNRGINQSKYYEIYNLLISNKWVKKQISHIKITIFSIGSAFLLFIGNIWIVGLLFENASPFSKVYNEFFFLILIPLLIVIFSAYSIFPPNSKWDQKKWRILIGTAVIILIFLMLGLFQSTSSIIIRSLKLGALPHVTLGVDDIGCRMFAVENSGVDCQLTKGLHLINNVNLLWRGDEYYVRFKAANNQQINLILPSEHVPGGIIIRSES